MVLIKDEVHVASQIIASTANQGSLQKTIRANLVLFDAQPHHFITQIPKRPHTPSNLDLTPSFAY
jgi:hypothetical protein